MTRVDVIEKAIKGRISWQQAADICRVTPRHMRRLREKYEELGKPGLKDGRRGKQQPPKVSVATVDKLCRLKRELYADFSTRHFHEFATEKHGLDISYTWTLLVLQAHGLVNKAPGRGKYRRRRERRPMTGMLLHLDGSRHEWIAGLPKHDLIVMLDDADGRILFARFYEHECTVSTLDALDHVLRRWGRFCELYTDRAGQFCNTSDAAQGPDEIQNGQVPRICRALGIRQILARTPQARGRGERAFGTIQGRLVPELRLHAIADYDAANRYLERHFIADFNRRFTVRPAESETAFVPIAGLDLTLLLSVQHERMVRNDNTVSFRKRRLQLPSTKHRSHFVRCRVTVHEFADGTLGVSFQNKLLARYSEDGELLKPIRKRNVA